MKLEGNCLTTAMGILPHRDVEQALQLSLSLDIPFWPQLPGVSFYEDMYAQVSEHFPGITLDLKRREIWFSLEQFHRELEEYLAHWDDESYFRLSPRYSAVYHNFLKKDLSPYPSIRGQSIGPVSFGLKIQDHERRPMIYHEDVREIIFDFVGRKLRAQYNELRKKHPRAFVWVDEPGLEMIFMSYTGYTSEKAFADYRLFLESFPGPRGVHLCGNPDWSFLLNLDLDILSVDVLAHGYIFTRYREEINSFLDRGGIISWGITPTLTEEFAREDLRSMIGKIKELWSYLEQGGISRKQILRQAWFAPARCCLINLDGEATVERSFKMLKEVAAHFKEEL
ncbi:MAG: hypothetical protein WAQ32_00400 [Dethiobacteria bacterium]|jgi:hypothetical protein|nr:hypothetical protein [Bacillota bacterium]NMD33504.1 hypothetical protein [Bacillota bacterium]HOB29610.1 hypothetical protein [Bacillota bacterium]HPZ42238.1 hypothetical protein [Bacillota bacterium]HQD52212.1 hypothetical protein [Bacillota bacterium]